MGNNSKKFSATQKKILERLLEGPMKQKDLVKEFKLQRSVAKYHLDRLIKDKLIKTKTIMEVGAVKIYELSINTLSLHRIRKILNKKAEHTILITGFGKFEAAYRIPDISKELLLRERPEIGKIDRIICFTTADSLEIRKNKEEEENLTPFSQLEIHSHDYEDYRRFGTTAFDDLEKTILTTIDKNEIFLDLTPLSKLLTIKLLDYAEKYKIPSFYVGINPEGNNFLIWVKE